MTRRQRRRWVQVALAVVGLVGLTGLVVLLRNQPWVQRGVLLLVLWQGFWYLVRALLMLSIWRREPELSATEKWWLALTAPIVLLFGVWWYRGRLSAWVAAGEMDDAV